jgi:hypothetical protein
MFCHGNQKDVINPGALASGDVSCAMYLFMLCKRPISDVLSLDVHRTYSNAQNLFSNNSAVPAIVTAVNAVQYIHVNDGFF